MLTYCSVTLGTDPEAFLEKDGRIIGSERVVPEEGWKHPFDSYRGWNPLVVRDGVQIELHPPTSSCRESVAEYLQHCMRVLRDKLTSHEGVTPNFSPVVDVSEEELEALSVKSRVLQCGPSRNLHDSSAIAKIADGYRKRSAGGHIHLGLNNLAKTLFPHREKIVPIADMLVGNTCVLIDRDINAAERRKVYGRAGEYRLPDHGVEYRVLSNWWMRSMPTMSLVMGLARMAVSVVHTDLNAGQSITDFGQKYKEQERGKSNSDTDWSVSIPANQNLQAQLYNAIEIPKLIEAINTNNFQLAWENYQAIKPFILEHVHSGNADYAYPLHSRNLDDFEFFVQKGLDYWFPIEGTMDRWMGSSPHSSGWESFLAERVHMERMKEEAISGTK